MRLSVPCPILDEAIAGLCKLFIKHLLSTHYVLGTVLNSEETKKGKRQSLLSRKSQSERRYNIHTPCIKKLQTG